MNPHPPSPDKSRSSALPTGVRCLVDQSYAPDGQMAAGRLLDLYVPAGAGPFPLIMWIHGGGWHSGDKQPEGDRLAKMFLPHGFAVAAVGYRLTSEAPFPAPIKDCDQALSWLRRHATEHCLDPQRVGLVGHSAGAHLCALMAVVGGRGVMAGVEQRVQAVVCWSPPCDLDRERGAWPRSMFAWNSEDKFSRTFFPGGVYDAEFARKASPASYVQSDVPAMLIVHGDADTVVPFGQAKAFARRMAEAGADIRFRVATGSGHDVMGVVEMEEALDFFRGKLRIGSPSQALN